MRADIVPGASFPDYELDDHTGTPRRLSEIQGERDPMIVVLSRGNFCPKDQVQHRLLVDFYPELVVGYVKVVTISTDDVRASRIFRSTVGAESLYFQSASSQRVPLLPSISAGARPG